ncbi:MAG: hypothetical protein ABL930_13470, partial [Pseudobdellovibrio sp.]
MNEPTKPTAPVPPTPPTLQAKVGGKKVGGKTVVPLKPTAPNEKAIKALEAGQSEEAKAAKSAEVAAKKAEKARIKAEKDAAAAKKKADREAAKAEREAAKLPRIEQNGVKEASVGTSSRAIWDLTQNLSIAKGALVTMAEVKAVCETEVGAWFVNKAGVNTKINPANVAIEYLQYRKFYALPPVVVEKVVDPAVEAAKVAKKAEREEAKAKKAAEKEQAKVTKASAKEQTK